MRAVSHGHPSEDRDHYQTSDERDAEGHPFHSEEYVRHLVGARDIAEAS
jgi:hypothetical protein